MDLEVNRISAEGPEILLAEVGLKVSWRRAGETLASVSSVQPPPSCAGPGPSRHAGMCGGSILTPMV